MTEWKSGSSAAFNDPSTWGYCERCAFEVSLTDEGLRVMHPKVRTGAASSVICIGSLKPPVTPTPRQALPLPQLSLHKNTNRAQRRRYWQKMRFIDRERARTNLEPLDPDLIGPEPSPALDAMLDLMGQPLTEEDCDVD